MLFLGDARQLAVMRKGEAHCVVTDPPYKLTSGGNGTPLYEGARRMSGCFSKTKYSNNGELIPVRITWAGIMDVCYTLLGDRGHAYVMTNGGNMEDALTAARLAGFRLHNVLVWDKGNQTPSRQYMRRVEFGLLLFKGEAFTINNPGDSNLFTFPNREKDSGHPTQKPVEFMRRWIENSTQPGETVADPFAGSGSTGVAALLAGRKFFGAEIDPEYHAIAERRIYGGLM